MTHRHTKFTEIRLEGGSATIFLIVETLGIDQYWFILEYFQNGLDKVFRDQTFGVVGKNYGIEPIGKSRNIFKKLLGLFLVNRLDGFFVNAEQLLLLRDDSRFARCTPFGQCGDN
ncbi:MAG: hypothetical protein BWX60_01109 [Candidatus Marinimicrobia bacterium ADurb.Bin030]|nr:MAG: hypothetical protein BWX60_01109 [Candidatus Marinimicrobia bacterium ADurb.Bin030]